MYDCYINELLLENKGDHNFRKKKRKKSLHEDMESMHLNPPPSLLLHTF